MINPERSKERINRLIREEMAIRKAIRVVAEAKAKRQGHLGVPVTKFILASGLMTVIVAFAIYPQSSSPHIVNALLCGLLVGLLFACITKLIVGPFLEHLIIYRPITTDRKSKIIFGIYISLFILFCATLVGTAFWVSHHTTAMKSTFIWEWIIK